MKLRVKALGLAVLGALLAAAPASAACSSATAGGVVTITCPAGTTETVPVPDHGGGVVLQAYGAGGGHAGLAFTAGYGGGVQATLTKAGPFSLDVVAATQGATDSAGGAGGVPGGGDGGPGGGGGGGASSITLAGAPLIIGGGGGGSGASSQFGSGGNGGSLSSLFYGNDGGLCGGQPPGTPPNCLFPTARGGSLTAGGAGQPPGADGSGHVGGVGGTGGGGGGGGLFGGGGGGGAAMDPRVNGGAGGGSSFVDPSLTDVSDPLGGTVAGVVSIAYAPPGAPTPTPTPTSTGTPGVTHTTTPSSGGGFVGLGSPSTVSGAAQPVAPTAAGVAVALDCAGATGTTCKGKVAVTLTEKLRGKKVIAVSAATKKKKVTVGNASYVIAAGKFTSVKVTLNKTGKALLKRFKKLTVVVNVTITTATGSKQLASRKVKLTKHK